MIVLTLKVRPSLLPTVYWSHSFRDLRTLTKLHMQHEMVHVLSFTESMAAVAGKIFGSESNSSSPAGPENVKEIATDADIQQLLREVNG